MYGTKHRYGGGFVRSLALFSGVRPFALKSEWQRRHDRPSIGARLHEPVDQHAPGFVVLLPQQHQGRASALELLVRKSEVGRQLVAGLGHRRAVQAGLQLQVV